MTENEIIIKLKELLLSEFELEDVDPDDIQADTPLFGDELGLDSIDAVEMVVMLQKHFNVAIKDTEDAKSAFASIQSLARYIQENTGK